MAFKFVWLVWAWPAPSCALWLLRQIEVLGMAGTPRLFLMVVPSTVMNCWLCNRWKAGPVSPSYEHLLSLVMSSLNGQPGKKYSDC